MASQSKSFRIEPWQSVPWGLQGYDLREIVNELTLDILFSHKYPIGKVLQKRGCWFLRQDRERLDFGERCGRVVASSTHHASISSKLFREGVSSFRMVGPSVMVFLRARS